MNTLATKNRSFYSALSLLTALQLSACGGSNKEQEPTPTDPIEEPAPTPIIADQTPPIITLIGESRVSLIQGKKYNDLGATATDDIDGEVAVSISGQVDSNVVGEYVIQYTATDKAGNSSRTTRIVSVIKALPIDNTPPTLQLNGESFISILQGQTYSELGAEAIDDIDGQVKVSVEGVVDTSTVGQYVVTYTAVDTAGNKSALTRTVEVRAPRPFITTWNAATSSSSNEDNNITIGTQSDKYTYSYSIEWGDGTLDTNIVGDISHRYEASGTYSITITGQFPALYFSHKDQDNDKLRSVEQWGDIKWLDMSHAFYHCDNLIINATDAPDLSQVTSMAGMFENASQFNADIGHWDTSTITDMSNLFRGTHFNKDISQWDTSSVTNMRDMFTLSRFNQPLNEWDTSSVANMSGMFNFTSYNHPLNNWNTSAVTDMSYMFAENPAFNQALNSWNTSAVVNMSAMFDNAQAFNQPLDQWDTSSVVDMSLMFEDTHAFNHNINYNSNTGAWNTASVTDMRRMFFRANAFNQPLDQWNTASVESFKLMFRGAKQFNQDISTWDTSSSTNFEGVFWYASAFDQDLSQWDMSSLSTPNNLGYFVSDSHLSIENYDRLLISLAEHNTDREVPLRNVYFHAKNLTHSNKAATARTSLINDYGWKFNDDMLTQNATFESHQELMFH